nr:MAG: replication associated protein [Cressdnaviricota sp.]
MSVRFDPVVVSFEPTNPVEAGGVTLNTPRAPAHQMYRWFFTLKREAIELSQLLEVLKEIAKQFTFSGENSEEGYEHWQGVFSLKTKEYFDTVKNHFPNEIHLERCKDWFKARAYCSKKETHVEGPYTEATELVRHLEITKFYPWQIHAWKIAIDSNVDDRIINWYWCKPGNSGKSALAKTMCVKLGASVFNSGKSADLAFALPDNPKIVVFDLPRTMEGHINYGAIECIKNGMIFSSKYESKCKVFNSPHIFVFANFEPDKTAMSSDRWSIHQIDANKNLKHTFKPLSIE